MLYSVYLALVGRSVCWSVGRSVGLSVGLSVSLSVSQMKDLDENVS